MSRRNQRFRQYVGIPFRPKHCCDCEEIEKQPPVVEPQPNTPIENTTIIEHRFDSDASLNSLIIERTISKTEIPDNTTQHTNVRDYFALTIRSKLEANNDNKIFHGIRFDTSPIREGKYDNLSAIVPVQHGNDNNLDIFVQEREVIDFDKPSIRIGEYGDIHNTYMNSNTVFKYNMYKRTPSEQHKIHGLLADDDHGEAQQGMGNRIVNMREIIDHLLPIGTIKQNIIRENNLQSIFTIRNTSLKCIPGTPWLLCNGFDMSGGITVPDLKELYGDFTNFLRDHFADRAIAIDSNTIPLPIIKAVGDNEVGNKSFDLRSFIHSGVIFNEQLLSMKFGLSGEIVFNFDHTHLMVAKDIIFDEELDAFFVVGTTSKNNQNGSVAIAKIPRNIRWNTSTNQADNIVTRYIPVENESSDSLGAFGTNIVNKTDGRNGSFYIGGIFVTRNTMHNRIKKEEYFIYQINKREFLGTTTNNTQPLTNMENLLTKNNITKNNDNENQFVYYYPSWDIDQFKFILSSLEMYYNDVSFLLHVVCNVRESVDASSNIFYIIIDGSNNVREFPGDISLNLPSVNLVRNSEDQIVTDIVIDNQEEKDKTLYVTGFEMRYHGNDNNAINDNNAEEISYTAYIATIKPEREANGNIRVDNFGNIDSGDISFNILPDASFANAIATSIVVDNSNVPIIAGVQESGKGDFFLGMYNIHADLEDQTSDASFVLVGISAETYDIITDIAIDSQTNRLIVVGNKGDIDPNRNANIIIQKFDISKNELDFNTVETFGIDSNGNPLDNSIENNGIISVRETIRYTSQGEDDEKTINEDKEIRQMFATSCLVDNRKNIIITGHVNSFDSFIIALKDNGERVSPGMHFSIGHDDDEI